MIEAISQRMLTVALISALLVASVLIIMLSDTAKQFATTVDAEMKCRNVAEASCAASGTMPASWDNDFIIGGEKRSCRDILDCSCYGTTLSCDLPSG
ncbi:MAG: hypothetical protein DRO99_03810 [Candidatus Aenigmatarchaeota archaeon]|nr:MAG: hypothetical protein DRO99_03810 [Candidatus Aenigmarchaeota archaeon]